MKKLILPLFAMSACAANAQFSIEPQAGLETSRTTIQSSDFSSFSPAGMHLAPRLSLRAEYKLKTGHGAFVGLATSGTTVEFKFTDPQAARTLYSSRSEDLQLRFEGGYQFTSKPIALGKGKISSFSKPRHNSYGRYGGGERRQCNGGGCSFRNSSSRYGGESSHKSMAQNKGMFLRIKPSLGIALAPTNSQLESEMKGGQTFYEYNTAMNTAVIAGTAFEFGSRNHTKFSVSFNYLRGIGNNQQTLNYGSVVKPVTSTFQSKTSAFNISFGMPISLGKKPVVTQHKPCYRSSYGGHCGRYRI